MPGSILSAFLDAMKKERERGETLLHCSGCALNLMVQCLIYEWKGTRLDLQREDEQVPVWEEGHKGHCMMMMMKWKKKKKKKREEPPAC